MPGRTLPTRHKTKLKKKSEAKQKRSHFHCFDLNQWQGINHREVKRDLVCTGIH